MVSARWFKDDDKVFGQVYNDLLSKVKQELGEDVNDIARFGLFTPEEHFIELAISQFEEGST